MDSTTPLDELAGFLSGNSAASISPQNPLGQNASPSANPSNPAMNKDMPGAWTNPSNPELNPSLPNAVTNPSNPQYNPNMPGATNNPSNYAYNPQMPGSMTNPASPKLNPNYPGSLMNPANPIHNPGFPVHQEVPRPPGLSENASLPPTHASLAEVDSLKGGDPTNVRRYIAANPWRPGQWGKAIVTPTGQPITWSTVLPPHATEPDDGYPFHTHAVNALGYGGRYAPEMRDMATIDPYGNVETYLQNEQGLLEKHVGDIVSTAQPQLWSEASEHVARSYQKTADNYTQDTKEWADPTEPRADSEPMPHGCTCRNGTDSQLKLYCPVHGLDGQWEKALDWSIPEGHPVGYPQDGPRTWVDSFTSSRSSGQAKGRRGSSSLHHDGDSDSVLQGLPIDSYPAHSGHRYQFDPANESNLDVHQRLVGTWQSHPSADPSGSRAPHSLDTFDNWGYSNEYVSPSKSSTTDVWKDHEGGQWDFAEDMSGPHTSANAYNAVHSSREHSAWYDKPQPSTTVQDQPRGWVDAVHSSLAGQPTS